MEVATAEEAVVVAMEVVAVTPPYPKQLGWQDSLSKLWHRCSLRRHKYYQLILLFLPPRIEASTQQATPRCTKMRNN